MAFVNELISDEDKQKIDWTKFKAWPFSDPHRPWKWTIDKERNVFLIPLGGGGPDGDRPDVFALHWDGQVIRFEAEITGSGTGKFWDTLFWKINNLAIPDNLHSQKEKILESVVNAIRAHGRFFSTEHVKTVHVTFA
ncbi:MAG: hypothetical protein P4L70_03950 [Parasulfuritortus sp.]|nr:hypothetical protein [Parasulfuritortus sp.]